MRHCDGSHCRTKLDLFIRPHTKAHRNHNIIIVVAVSWGTQQLGSHTYMYAHTHTHTHTHNVTEMGKRKMTEAHFNVSVVILFLEVSLV